MTLDRANARTVRTNALRWQKRRREQGWIAARRIRLALGRLERADGNKSGKAAACPAQVADEDNHAWRPGWSRYSPRSLYEI